jgi:acyl-coenzyme A synthetase/AMP-(fatty) acid ligase
MIDTILPSGAEVTFVDDLPKTSTGKPLRRRLGRLDT